MMFSYKVKESEIIVSGRPKKLSENPEKELEEEYHADAYLSVTDTFAVAPGNKIFVWFPWNEGRKPINLI